MYLVTGATGHVGGAVARQLHEQGHTVRALVRDPSGAASLPAEIELAAGDLDDPASVAKAVTGAEAIFLMHVGTGTEQAKTMIAAAQDAEVPRIVLLSSAGARLLPLDDNPMGAAFAAREQILRESGLGVTYLPPIDRERHRHAEICLVRYPPRAFVVACRGLTRGAPVTGEQRESQAQLYQIRVRGRLGQTLRSAFPALRARVDGGDTVLTGVLADQAAVYGVLAEAEALGLELIEVRRLTSDEPREPSS